MSNVIDFDSIKKKSKESNMKKNFYDTLSPSEKMARKLERLAELCRDGQITNIDVLFNQNNGDGSSPLFCLLSDKGCDANALIRFICRWDELEQAISKKDANFRVAYFNDIDGD